MGDKDFFLSPDDAMTMGDIDYMRTSKRTRRTFPKTLKNKDGFAVENEVSSMEDRNNLYTGSNNTANTAYNPAPSFQPQSGFNSSSAAVSSNQVQQSTPDTAPTFQPQANPDALKPSVAKRRPSDNSMDMFRNMAKNIGK
jgi:hypothetical protein